MTQAIATQAGAEVLFRSVPRGEVAQAGVEVLNRVGSRVEAAQAGAEVLHRVIPQFSLAQAGVELLFKSVACTRRDVQIWTITRTDGEVFRFTSQDMDLEWPPGSGTMFKACDSLVPSASEAVSELDAAANMDLSGAIGEGGISTRDLYAGLFDGARVDAWLVPASGNGGQHLLLRGTFGPIEQSDTGFKAELLGDGAKLKQTPLVSLVQPGCRWLSGKYGGFGGPFCGKSLAGLAVTGTIDAGDGLRGFTDAARIEAAGYFAMGRVTFTSGANAGVTAEIKEHGAGGVFILWPRLAFPPVMGDEYSMIPGCTGLHEASGGTNGCAAWGQQLRFGGFRKVPGKDQRSKAADVRS